MPSANSTARAAYWNGRLLQADIRKNRTVCCRWIPNSYVTRGSLALPTSHRSCLSANAWSKFSTCARRSPMRSARSSVISSRTPSAALSRKEFGHLVEDTIRRIESADFLPHSGIRFPQNPCSTCPYVGLCLGKQAMADAALVRRPGAENLDWLDELSY